MYSDKKLFIIEWETDKFSDGSNHYIAGSPAFDLDTFKRWGEIIKKIL